MRRTCIASAMVLVSVAFQTFAQQEPTTSTQKKVAKDNLPASQTMDKEALQKYQAKQASAKHTPAKANK